MIKRTTTKLVDSPYHATALAHLPWLISNQENAIQFRLIEHQIYLLQQKDNYETPLL